jgi:SAM-dependent methyltransferase
LDLADYYARDYKTLSRSADEDDLYEIRRAVPVYRNEHMADTLLRLVPDIDKESFGPILDFGCGKSLVMRHLKRIAGKRDVYLYDVSEDYKGFWNLVVPASQYACFAPPTSWRGKFSLVTSFFSLEHVANPAAELAAVAKLLAANGLLYIVVPNMYSANRADMLVIDHVQHYSEASMQQLLAQGGYELLRADHESHVQASIYVARLASTAAIAAFSRKRTSEVALECAEIARFWTSVDDDLTCFQQRLDEKGTTRYLIIGAGIIGSYIFASLKRPERVVAFVDSNLHKQRKGWQGRPVLAPGTFSADSSMAVFSGFNAQQADRLLRQMLPQNIPVENVWTLETIARSFPGIR